MTKRILGVALAAVLVLGLGGAALAATSPARPSGDVAEAALALAADPAPPPADPKAQRQALQACVKPKVAAGTERKAARQECAAQLGIDANKLKRAAAVRRFRLGRAAHAEAVVPKAEGQWETDTVDRGKVTAASADSLSVQRPDGPTVTVKVTPATKVKGAAAVADLAAGRQVVVVSAAGEARSVVARG